MSTLSSSYFEGQCCPLARRGYSRDGRHGTLQVNHGLLTDARGCPVAVSVHEGNTADSKTFMPAVQKLRDDFGIKRMVIVEERNNCDFERIICESLLTGSRAGSIHSIDANSAALALKYLGEILNSRRNVFC